MSLLVAFGAGEIGDRQINEDRWPSCTPFVWARPEDERGGQESDRGSAFFVGRFRNTQSSPIPLRRHRDARFNQVGSKAKPLALGSGPRFSSERPFWVKGGLWPAGGWHSRSTPSSGNTRAFRHLRFVPTAAIPARSPFRYKAKSGRVGCTSPHYAIWIDMSAFRPSGANFIST